MVSIELQIKSEDSEKVIERTPLIYHLVSFIKSYVFLACLFVMPIVATIIYIGFRGDLDMDVIIYHYRIHSFNGCNNRKIS